MKTRKPIKPRKLVQAPSQKVSLLNINRKVTLVGPGGTAQAAPEDVAIAGDGGLATGRDFSICIASQDARAFAGAGGIATVGPRGFASANNYGAAIAGGESRADVNQYGVALALGNGYANGDRSSTAMVTDGLAQTREGGIATACTVGGVAISTGPSVLVASEDDIFLRGAEGSVFVGMTAQSHLPIAVAKVGAGGLLADTYYKYIQGNFLLVEGGELAAVEQKVAEIQSRPLPAAVRAKRVNEVKRKARG